MTRLGVWYVWTLLARGEVRSAELPAVLCQRVDLYRLTDLWDGVKDSDDGSGNALWMEHATQIAGWVRETAIGETEGLEERVLALLEPALERRLPKDIGPPPERPYGCWTYNLGWPGLADGPGLLGRLSNPAHRSAMLRRCVGLRAAPSRDGVLHIMNVEVPKSPFDDMGRLAESLRALIAEVRTEHPQVRELWCNTWLNEHPSFHELMPEAWFRNATVSPPGHYRNWWGQFARRDGDFNEATAKKFRDSGGVFPFRALLCHARLVEVDQHVSRSF